MVTYQELNPEFCVDHPDDAACLGRGKPDGSGQVGGIASASCINNAECTAPTPVCDTTRSTRRDLRSARPECTEHTSNNIVFGNLSPATVSQVVADNCQFASSDIGPTTFGGTGKIAGDPQFVSSATGDFHLQVTSPARDAADPATTLAVDLDGVPRPQGAGRDMGAYENQ